MPDARTVIPGHVVTYHGGKMSLNVLDVPTPAAIAAAKRASGHREQPPVPPWARERRSSNRRP